MSVEPVVISSIHIFLSFDSRLQMSFQPLAWVKIKPTPHYLQVRNFGHDLFLKDQILLVSFVFVKLCHSTKDDRPLQKSSACLSRHFMQIYQRCTWTKRSRRSSPRRCDWDCEGRALRVLSDRASRKTPRGLFIFTHHYFLVLYFVLGYYKVDVEFDVS